MSNDVKAGWWPVNEGRELGYFDGHAWTGDRVPNPDAPPPSALDRLDWGTWQPWLAAVLAFIILTVLVLVPAAWVLSLG